jgi:transcriptional regulator with XRE-family HTH domain
LLISQAVGLTASKSLVYHGVSLNRVHTLIDTIIRLKRLSQVDVAERSGIHASNLSKFLNGETDIRASSLTEIMNALDVSLETMLESEIESLLGKKKSDSVGEAFETLMSETDPFAAKAMLETLAKHVQRPTHPDVKSALNVMSAYKSTLRSVRRDA